MKNSTTYLIPAGTEVKTRNINRQLRLRPHVTRQDLRFDQTYNTGDGGFLVYFKQGNWLIAVEASQVVCGRKSLLQSPAA